MRLISEISHLTIKDTLGVHLLAHKRWRQNGRGDKFSGSVLAVGKTDAYALLLREKLSVS